MGARSITRSRRTARLSAVVLIVLWVLPSASLRAAAQSGISLSVDPHRGLVPGQWVDASWTGVPSGDPVYLRQCTLHPATIRDCSYAGAQALHSGGIAPATGTGWVTFPVLGVVNQTTPKDRFACSDERPCTIALFTDAGATDLDHAVLEPIRFAIDSSTCRDPSSGDVVVQGEGTFAFSRAFRGWEGQLCRSPHDVHVRLDGTTSPRGESAFVEDRSDFAVTIRPLVKDSVSALASDRRRFAYAPMIGSGLAFAFRMTDPTTGEPITSLRLTPDQLAAIFTGQLRDLGSDPDVLAQNPGLSFPPVLHAVGRADASAQTELLTSWFLTVARQTYRDGGPAFDGKPTDSYPGVGAIALEPGPRAVAQAVADPDVPDTSQVGTIGWMDSSVAAMYGLPTVLVQNEAGRFVGPTTQALSASIRDMRPNPDGVTRSPRFTTHDARAYPLPVVSYVVAQTSVSKDFDDQKADVLRAFIRFAAASVDRARTSAERTLPAGYAPLPAPMTADARHAAAALPRTDFAPPGGSGGGGGGFGFGGGGGGVGGGGGGFGGGGGAGGTGVVGRDGGGEATSSSSGAAPILLPEAATTSARGRYAWPAVLVFGVGLLVLGLLLPLALWIGSRIGARRASAAIAAADGSEGGTRAGTDVR